MAKRFLALMRAVACLAVGVMFATTASAQSRAPSDVQLQTAAQASFPEFFELLALPNDAIVPADIRRNADWLQRAFERRGFSRAAVAERRQADAVRRVWEAGAGPENNPVLHAFRRPAGVARTVGAARVRGKPWSSRATHPVHGRVGAGAERLRLQDAPLDPELRVFARSASDDKGPIVMLLAAFDALRAAGIEPAIHVKVHPRQRRRKGFADAGCSGQGACRPASGRWAGALRWPEASEQPADAGFRQSRRRDGDTDRARSARAAAQRPSRQLHAESRAAPRRAAGDDEGRATGA